MRQKLMYLAHEAVIRKFIFRADESQIMAHRWDKTLSDVVPKHAACQSNQKKQR